MERKTLSAQGMYALVRKQVQGIPEQRRSTSCEISLSDAILSAAALFALKFPSLLQFDQGQSDPTINDNLRTLFGIKRIPCDTTLREILDDVKTSSLQDLFLPLYREAQRGKVLESFVYHEGGYLVSVDGSGFFSSSRIHCKHCLEKHHSSGEVTYHHQMLCAVMVHPGNKEVLPLAPEPIVRQDGESKQDCERKASERLLRRMRKEHPYLKIIVTEDGLYSNGPHLRLLEALSMGYIVGCKPSDHRSLFAHVEGAEKLGEVQHYRRKEGSTEYQFRWMEQVPLNEQHPDLLVNFLEFWETKAGGKKLHMSWVTSLPLCEDTVETVMKGGRARWRIENETFNTLKNLGYQFEHNFGHGYENLSNNLAVVMMLVFLIDQLQQRCSEPFQKALQHSKRKLYLWNRMKGYFLVLRFSSWLDFLHTLGTDEHPVRVDTS